MSDETYHGIEPAIRALYASHPEREWLRMERHRSEFAVTLRALQEHLPQPPARVLDCGSGPGRYAIALAEQGYDVTLFDLSPDQLSIARARSAEAGVTLSGFDLGTATDLSRYPDESFDAVLLMGPLYHLLEAEARTTALAEAYRVLKPGGWLFVAFISRYAAHIDAIANYPDQAPGDSEDYHLAAATGIVPPSADGSVTFVAYEAHPAEVRPLCRSVGLEVISVVAVEGLAAGREEKLNALTGKDWEFWVDVNYEIGQDPTTHGGAMHLLAVCRRPQWRATLRKLVQTLDAQDIDYKVVGSAALALHGIPVSVLDLDLEMSQEAAYRFQTLFPDRSLTPVAWLEGDGVRSHFGIFDFDGVHVDVMADLERKTGGHWAPSFSQTCETIVLDGVAVRSVALEEGVLAYLRLGRLDRAAMALPECDPARFRALLSEAVRTGMF